MWEIINNILAVIGLLSLIMTIVRIIWTFSDGSEWIDNVHIEEYPLITMLPLTKGVYPQYYPDSPEKIKDEDATQNLFIPENTIIHNATLKRLDESSIANGEEKYITVHKFKTITPNSPICIVACRRYSIPEYVLEWKVEYGGKATYYFFDDPYNNNNNLNGFEYHFGIVSKIRNVLDLK